MKGNERKLHIWLDEEGNFLTVTWGFRPGYYLETNDERVMVRLDMEGNVQGFQVDDLKSISNRFVEVEHSTEWWDQLGKDKRGSRPRCIMLVDGSEEEVAERLTGLVAMPNIKVSLEDRWMPRGKPEKLQCDKWDTTPANEADLHKADSLLQYDIRVQLRDWWLAVGRSPRTPNWDIASTCSVDGKQGLLLIEAKAHAAELAPKSDKCGSRNDANLERILQAISQAQNGLHVATEGPWNLSGDHHYQLSNRFAWAWKLASLGVPVVLLYLGFLQAQDMAGKKLFMSDADWVSAVKKYGSEIVDNGCWGQRLDIGGTPLYPLLRTYNQEFYP